MARGMRLLFAVFLCYIALLQISLAYPYPADSFELPGVLALDCPEKCFVGEVCRCSIRNCGNGFISVGNAEGKPVDSFAMILSGQLPFSFFLGHAFTKPFNFSSEGVASFSLICLDSRNFGSAKRNILVTFPPVLNASPLRSAPFSQPVRYVGDEFPIFTNKSFNGPGIAYSAESFIISGPSQRSVWYMPVPSIYEGQAPIYLAFRADKPDLVESYRFYERTPENLVLEVTTKALSSGQSVIIEWGAYTFHVYKNYSTCPANSKILPADQYPAEVRQYLSPTKEVQSDHPEIVQRAQQIKGNSDDILNVTQNILSFMWSYNNPSAPDNCTALATLRSNGGCCCTNWANLAAALLRASGIPARVLANYPTAVGSDNYCLATHYDTAYYVPGYGWRYIDSIMGKSVVQPYEHVVISPVNIQDEDMSLVHNTYMCSGVPYYSMLELGSERPNTKNYYGTIKCVDENNQPSTGATTAGGVTEFSGDLSVEFELTKMMWNKCLPLKVAGTEPADAREYQYRAAMSTDLVSYIYNVQKAAQACSFGAICTPGNVSGCSVCNSNGTAWVEDDSKCANDQICLNGNCTSLLATNKSFNAGGFVNEPFTWDYSFYLPSSVASAETNDSGHIQWSGLTAIINYATVGDKTVFFIFKDAAGNLVSMGTGRVRIVEKDSSYWETKPRLCFSCDLVRKNFYNNKINYPNDGGIDYEKTETAARSIGLTGLTHHVPYLNGMAELEGLLQNTDLEIWPTLYPDTVASSKTTMPFKDDYEAWAEYFANQSLIYPSLKGFLIDDTFILISQSPKFSPIYLRRINQAKDRVNPNLRFGPVIYPDNSAVNEITTYYSPTSPYRPYISDVASLWYWSSYMKNVNIQSLDSHLNTASTTIQPVPYMMGIYPLAYNLKSDNIFYDKSTLSNMLNLSLIKSDGVSLFNIPLWAYDYDTNKANASLFRQAANDDPSFDYKLVLSDGRMTTIGLYQSVYQNVPLPSVINSAQISFSVKDTFEAAAPNGFQFKQLLVNDKVLWESDVLSDGTGALSKTIDLKGNISGSMARIEIRSFDKGSTWGKQADLYIGKINLTINGNQVPNNWSFDSGIAYIGKYRELLSTISESFSPYTPKICTPNAVSGCRVCNSFGTQWLDDDSRCSAGQKCVNGSCVYTCTSICAEGSKQCSGSGYQTCLDTNGDTCFEWSSVTSCPTGQLCYNGVCMVSCTPETCSSLGHTCGNWSDGCNSTMNCGTCPSGQVCQSGTCTDECADECSANGTKQCMGETGYQACGNYDNDTCLEWSGLTPCPTNQVCANGTCAANCTDECGPENHTACTAGTTYKKCSDYDNDTCLEWSDSIICATGKKCIDGQCLDDNTCPTNGWYVASSGNACNSTLFCDEIREEYRAYEPGCLYQIGQKRSTLVNCQSCGTNFCQGALYVRYYCLNRQCVQDSVECSDCSCTCGNYNVSESNFCSDDLDNDCDNQTDYRDCDCGTGLESILVNTSGIEEDQDIIVECPTSRGGQACVSAFIGSSPCQRHEGAFICNAGSPGTKEIKCMISGSCCLLGEGELNVTVEVNSSQSPQSKSCSDYSSSECGNHSECEVCPQCLGKKSGTYEGQCRAKGDCPYSCAKGKCGSECAGSYDCWDYCSGGILYSGGSCSEYCSCVYNQTACSGTCGLCKEFSCQGDGCVCQATSDCCGNKICESGEECAICPLDCQCEDEPEGGTVNSVEEENARQAIAEAEKLIEDAEAKNRDKAQELLEQAKAELTSKNYDKAIELAVEAKEATSAEDYTSLIIMAVALIAVVLAIAFVFLKRKGQEKDVDKILGEMGKK